MAPAYPDGQRLRYSSVRRVSAALSRGAVILLRSPERAARLELKRVIGLPLERVRWTGVGRVQINGRWLREPYARFSNPPPGDDEHAECQVRAGHYFVVGDNRLYSHDSRHYGPVSRRVLLGKIVSIQHMKTS